MYRYRFAFRSFNLQLSFVIVQSEFILISYLPDFMFSILQFPFPDCNFQVSSFCHLHFKISVLLCSFTIYNYHLSFLVFSLHLPFVIVQVYRGVWIPCPHPTMWLASFLGPKLLGSHIYIYIYIYIINNCLRFAIPMPVSRNGNGYEKWNSNESNETTEQILGSDLDLGPFMEDLLDRCWILLGTVFHCVVFSEGSLSSRLVL